MGCVKLCSCGFFAFCLLFGAGGGLSLQPGDVPGDRPAVPQPERQYIYAHIIAVHIDPDLPVQIREVLLPELPVDRVLLVEAHLGDQVVHLLRPCHRQHIPHRHGVDMDLPGKLVLGPGGRRGGPLIGFGSGPADAGGAEIPPENLVARIVILEDDGPRGLRHRGGAELRIQAQGKDH